MCVQWYEGKPDLRWSSVPRSPRVSLMASPALSICNGTTSMNQRPYRIRTSLTKSDMAATLKPFWQTSCTGSARICVIAKNLGFALADRDWADHRKMNRKVRIKSRDASTHPNETKLKASLVRASENLGWVVFEHALQTPAKL